MNTITDDIDFLAFLGTQESQFLERPEKWREQLKAICQSGTEAVGDRLPWSKTWPYVRFRPGEVSIWAGVNGHGKSMVTGMVALWLSRVTTVLIASLEMKPESTLMRMLRQASGSRTIEPDYVDAFLDWSKNLWIYDQLDSVDSNRILGMIHYASKELGIKHVFLDSLVKCNIGTDDYNRQKQFLDRICWAAKSCNIHVHVVHHMRKGNDEANRPGKWDVKGAGELVDLCDNLLIHWRNFDQEKKLIERSFGKLVDVDSEAPNAILTVAKQRHGEWEGPIKLWFHPESMQFVGEYASSPLEFLL